MIVFIELTHAEPPGQLFPSSYKEGTAIGNLTPAEALLQRNQQHKKEGFIWSGRCAWQTVSVSEHGTPSTQIVGDLNAGLSPLHRT